MTELVTADFGKLRNAEHQTCGVIKGIKSGNKSGQLPFVKAAGSRRVQGRVDLAVLAKPVHVAAPRARFDFAKQLNRFGLEARLARIGVGITGAALSPRRGGILNMRPLPSAL
jgi:hypothetical protein